MTDQYRTESTVGWTGLMVFAATMMIIGGMLNAIYGLVAIVNDTWLVFTNTSVLLLDISAWGWFHLILGIALMVAGFGVMVGNTAARVVGVIVASLHIVVNFALMPLYPLWSITIIALSILVIWALTAHGGELKQA